MTRPLIFFYFFFNDTATTEIYTLSLHDALPISKFRAWELHLVRLVAGICPPTVPVASKEVIRPQVPLRPDHLDRKSTRLNSSHVRISYAVFCLKKKKTDVSWHD